MPSAAREPRSPCRTQMSPARSFSHCVYIFACVRLGSLGRWRAQLVSWVVRPRTCFLTRVAFFARLVYCFTSAARLPFSFVTRRERRERKEVWERAKKTKKQRRGSVFFCFFLKVPSLVFVRHLATASVRATRVSALLVC